jgi:hypothetical protein
MEQAEEQQKAKVCLCGAAHIHLLSQASLATDMEASRSNGFQRFGLWEAMVF